MASVFARKLVHELPALTGLDGRALDEAFAAFVPFELGPGETLMDPEDDAYPTLVVVSGSLSLITDGRPSLRLAALSCGDVIGGETLHGSTTPPARLMTESVVQVLMLEPEGASWLASIGNPVVDGLQRAALQTYARALRGADKRLTNMARLPDAPVMLAPPSLLQRLGGRLKRVRSGPPHPLPLLAKGPTFKRTDAVASGWLVDRLKPVALSGKQILQMERSDYAGAWIVAEGTLALSRDIKATESDQMALLGPGALVGLPGLIDGGPSPVTCAGEGSVWLYEIPTAIREELLTLPECRPLRTAMLRALAAQVSAAREGLSQTSIEARRGAITDRRSLRATSAALWSIPS